MRRTGVEFEISPSVSKIIAIWVRTIETQKNQCLFHHFLRFEKDRQFGVLVRYVFRFKGSK